MTPLAHLFGVLGISASWHLAAGTVLALNPAMKLLFVGLTLAALVATACNNKPAQPAPGVAANHEQAAAEQHYACPMHKDVTDTKPSKCPKCGMTLALTEK